MQRSSLEHSRARIDFGRHAENHLVPRNFGAKHIDKVLFEVVHHGTDVLVVGERHGTFACGAKRRCLKSSFAKCGWMQPEQHIEIKDIAWLCLTSPAESTDFLLDHRDRTVPVYPRGTSAQSASDLGVKLAQRVVIRLVAAGG